MSHDSNYVTLAKARSIAQAVRHRHGGTDQALARLDEEIGRQEKATLEERVQTLALIDEMEARYPADIFGDPPPGEHGKTVDSCSARAMRHVLGQVRLELRRLHIRRSAPADACEDCLEQVPNLLLTETQRRSWEREGGPMAPHGAAHWAVVSAGESRGCLTSYAVTATCGAKFAYQVDSGD